MIFYLATHISVFRSFVRFVPFYFDLYFECLSCLQWNCVRRICSSAWNSFQPSGVTTAGTICTRFMCDFNEQSHLLHSHCDIHQISFRNMMGFVFRKLLDSLCQPMSHSYSALESLTSHAFGKQLLEWQTALQTKMQTQHPRRSSGLKNIDINKLANKLFTIVIFVGVVITIELRASFYLVKLFFQHFRIKIIKRQNTDFHSGRRSIRYCRIRYCRIR